MQQEISENKDINIENANEGPKKIEDKEPENPAPPIENEKKTDIESANENKSKEETKNE